MSTYADYEDAVQQVVNSTATRLGQAHSKNLINRVVRRICKKRAWSFMDAHFAIRTWPRNSITVTLTKGKKLVTITTGSITKAYQMGFFTAATTGTGTVPRLRIKKVLTTTTFEMYGPWAGDDEAGVSAEVYQDTYPLPPDALAVHEGTLWYERAPWIMVPLARRTVEQLQLDNAGSSGDSWGFVDKVPNEVELWREGTAQTADNDTALTTGATTPDWANTMLTEVVTGDVLVGWSLQFKHALVKNRVRLNGIHSVTDGNNLTLWEEYHGLAADISYVIGPVGHPMIRLAAAPENSRLVGGLYRRRPLGLYDADDPSPIPDEHEDVVVDYACARALRRVDDDQGALILAKEIRADYLEGLAEMMSDDHPNRDAVIYPDRHDATALDPRPDALGRDYASFPAS